MLMYFQIVYPETRRVSETQIIVWCADAIANGEVGEEYKEACEKGDAMTCAKALHEVGNITLARGEP